MAGEERIPAFAALMVGEWAGPLAEVIHRTRRIPDFQSRDRELDSAFRQAVTSGRSFMHAARDWLFGVRTEYSEESLRSAVGLANDAVWDEVFGPGLWDCRLSAKTIRDRLTTRMRDHVIKWAEERGMDEWEIERLVILAGTRALEDTSGKGGGE